MKIKFMRILTLLLAITAVFLLSACGAEKTFHSNEDRDNEEESTVQGVLCEQSMIASSHHPEAFVCVNDREYKRSISGFEIGWQRTSLDGTMLAFLASDELYVCDGEEIFLVSDQVTKAELSVSGRGLIYKKRSSDAYDWYHYDVAARKSTLLSKQGEYESNAQISPDGKSVAYMQEDGLMLYDGTQTHKVAETNVNLVAISDGGTYVFGTERKDKKVTLCCYNSAGERQILGQADRSKPMGFNADHTQVLFDFEDGGWISEGGKPAQKVFDTMPQLLVPPGCKLQEDRDYVTYPVFDLYGQIYTGADRVLRLERGNTAQQLLTEAANVKYDTSGKYLYYIYGGAQLRCAKVSDGTEVSRKNLSRYVTDYVFSDGGKQLYYIADRTLYGINEEIDDEAVVIYEDVDELAITKENCVCFISNGDAYRFQEGEKPELAVQVVHWLYTSPNGFVYARAGDKYCCLLPQKKLSREEQEKKKWMN